LTQRTDNLSGTKRRQEEKGRHFVLGVQDSFAAPDISSRLIRVGQIIRIRSRIQDALGLGEHHMQMHLHCLPECAVRRALGSARVADIQFPNTTAKDFNGKLVYLPQAPPSGYVAKPYRVVKEP
jgi:hypothetical protein